MEALLPLLAEALKGQGLYLVIGVLAGFVLLFKGPEYISVILQHLRESKKITSDISIAQRKLEQDIGTRLRKKENRNSKTRS